MVQRGLQRNGYHALAHEIARTALDCVVKTFEDTGTLWENYAPEKPERGSASLGDFVGWSGIFPITTLFEAVFGLSIRADKREIVWDVRLTEEFGVRQLPVGAYGMVDLHCKARASEVEKPEITVRAELPLTLILRWNGQEEVLHIEGRKDGAAC